eukprot:3712900-Alexandrium_andersonii.AAC.1
MFRASAVRAASSGEDPWSNTVDAEWQDPWRGTAHSSSWEADLTVGRAALSVDVQDRLAWKQ